MTVVVLADANVGVLIVENLARLDQLEPGRRYQFSFLPLRLAGLDGSPVRAAAWASPPDRWRVS